MNLHDEIKMAVDMFRRFGETDMAQSLDPEEIIPHFLRGRSAAYQVVSDHLESVLAHHAH